MELNKSYPQAICEELKKYVKGQDEYCKQLSVFGHLHELKCKGLIDRKMASNLLVVGPSGCGKTYGVEVLAKLLNCNFKKVDCSNITSIGYKGNSIGKMMLSLDVDDENGLIVFFDELDKVYDPYQESNRAATKVYEEFLKLMEDDQYAYEESTIDLSKVSFIFAGAFLRLTDKKNKSDLFTNQKNDIQLIDDDFVRYENVPVEFMGRIDKVISVNQLSYQQYEDIIFHSKGSLYQRLDMLIQRRKGQLYVSDDVKEHLIDLASTSQFGVRGVNKEIKTFINEYLYQSEMNYQIQEFHILNYHHETQEYEYQVIKEPIVIEKKEKSKLYIEDKDDIERVQEFLDFFKEEVKSLNENEQKGIKILLDYHVDMLVSLYMAEFEISYNLFKIFVQQGIFRSLIMIEDLYQDEMELDDADYQKAIETRQALHEYGSEEELRDILYKKIELFEDMEVCING